MSKTTFILGAIAVTIFSVSACKGDTKGGSEATASATATAEAKPARTSLPAPFASVYLGMPRAELLKEYPPEGKVDACQVRLLGPKSYAPEVKPKPHGRCVTVDDVAGLSVDEVSHVIDVGEAIDAERANLVSDGLLLTVAQIRGALRAGLLPIEALTAASEPGKSEAQSVLFTAAVLLDGSSKFAAAQSSRRPIGASFKEDCGGVDPDAARAYAKGELTLGQIDTEARKRVAYGKCRGPYVRNEQTHRRQFVALTGGLAAMGLARAAAKDGKLIAEAPATYQTYTTRSGLKPPVAKLGVLVATALEETEKYFSDAVVITGGSDAKGDFSSALVWIDGGVVSRVLLNLSLPDVDVLKTELTKTYGEPTSSEGSVVTWKTKTRDDVRLDVGGAQALIVSKQDTKK
ncbi:MAG: hypothetical protein KC731_19305 [Myxococcales bacterium]|nr:hypothetical protein [Myxococcales bacterium]